MRNLVDLCIVALVLAGVSFAQTQTADMVTVPAGPFTMGSDSGPADERPAHTVTLPAFSIDRNQVTNAQFAAFLKSLGPKSARSDSYYQEDDGDARIHFRNGQWIVESGFENHAVVEPSWVGASEYCRWLGKRLPTEAEWEKAARGTDGRKYPWGNQPPDRSRAQYGGGWRETAVVARFPSGASPYGVLDMAGNTWEWVSSAYRPYPYNATDGRENPAHGPVRGTRGGGQDSSPDELTTTQRGRDLSREFQAGHHNIGFRCAR
jgi:iron(II)-dependent oxidoreductase